MMWSASITAHSSGWTTTSPAFAPRWVSCASIPPKAMRRSRVLTDLVRRSGLREAYVAMDCLRGRPAPGLPYHPAFGRAYLVCFAIPWVWLFTPEQQARGVHAIVAKTPRIAPESVDPPPELPLGDLTQANFEAHDAGAETAILTDGHGLITEGPGFNVFAVIDGVVVSPDRGALEGITRKTVFELCELKGIGSDVRPLRVDEFEDADEIFLSTTAGGIMPVSRLGAAFSAMIGRAQSRPGCARRSGRSAPRAGTRHRSTTSARSSGPLPDGAAKPRDPGACRYARHRHHVPRSVGASGPPARSPASPGRAVTGVVLEMTGLEKGCLARGEERVDRRLAGFGGVAPAPMRAAVPVAKMG